MDSLSDNPNAKTTLIWDIFVIIWVGYAFSFPG